jgi:hypothetical protein
MAKGRFKTAAVLLALVLVVGVGLAVSEAGGFGSRGAVADVTAPVVGLTRAYGVVVPGCGGCARERRGFTPLKRQRSMNVALAPARAGAREGTWCFVLTDGLREAEVTVVVSAANTGGPYTKHFVSEDARWILGGPNCGPGQVEIQTAGLTIEGNRLVAVPDGELAFSFSVDAR